MAIIPTVNANILPSLSVFLVALLYSSVGHGGASGYLAILSLMNANQSEAISTALLLNVLVAGISSFSFIKAGHFNLKLTLPFVCTSVPFAFLAGLTNINTTVYELMLSLFLVIAALRLILPKPYEGKAVACSIPLASLAGGAIGYLSGLVGIGGGILLSPLILISRWANAKTTSATAAVFIVCNSLAGLSGRLINGSFNSGSLSMSLAAAVIGGFVGSQLGAHFIGSRNIERLLAVVLLIAAIKLVINLAKTI